MALVQPLERPAPLLGKGVPPTVGARRERRVQPIRLERRHGLGGGFRLVAAHPEHIDRQN